MRLIKVTGLSSNQPIYVNIDRLLFIEQPSSSHTCLFVDAKTYINVQESADVVLKLIAEKVND